MANALRLACVRGGVFEPRQAFPATENGLIGVRQGATLRVDNVFLSSGGTRILNGVSMQVLKGQALGMI